MPTFEITGPDGARYRVTAPEGATEQEILSRVQAEAQSAAAPKPTATAEADPYRVAARKEIDELKAKGVPVGGGALSRLVAQGGSFSAADDLLAMATTPLEMIKRGTWDPREAYKYTKAREDLLLEDARKDAGAAGTAAEIVGGIGSGTALANAGVTAARLLPRGAGLLQRSGASLVDGAGMGVVAGAMEGNSLAERAENAAKGGLLGGAVGGAAPSVLGLLGAAASPVISNIRARWNPEGYARSQVARGLVESGRSARDVADDVALAAREGQGMFTVADAMGNPGQRMLSTVARAPGPGRTDVVEFLEGRQAGQGRRVAGALAEGFDAPRTAAQTRAAMTQARDDAADIAYEAARQGARPVNVSRVVARIDQTLQPGLNQLARPQSGISNDSVESALESIRARLTDGRSVQTDFTALQRVRGDLSDMIQAAQRAGAGNRARLLGQALRELDAAMELASPGFRQANRNFAQATRDIETIDTGRTAALRGRPEDTIPAFRGLSPEGQTAHRVGYVDPLIEQAQGAAFGVNKARPLINDAFADEAAAMAPGADLMTRRIGREHTMFETRNQALGGSRTADNLADADAMGIDPTIVGQVLSGNWGGALRSMLAAGSNALSGNTAQVREAVGRILLQRGTNLPPQQLQAMLDEAVRRIQAIQGMARNLGRGAAGGLAVTPAAAGVAAGQTQQSR